MTREYQIMPEPNNRKVLSFKAVVVMTTHGDFNPTLSIVELALQKAGLTFVMPASIEAPIVISFND